MKLSFPWRAIVLNGTAPIPRFELEYDSEPRKGVWVAAVHYRPLLVRRGTFVHVRYKLVQCSFIKCSLFNAAIGNQVYLNDANKRGICGHNSNALVSAIQAVRDRERERERETDMYIYQGRAVLWVILKSKKKIKKIKKILIFLY